MGDAPSGGAEGELESESYRTLDTKTLIQPPSSTKTVECEGVTMPLDTSTYSLALLRLDGRRWNELRRMHAQISTQPTADGSSYLEMGNTKVICTVAGPAEGRKAGGGGGSGGDANAMVQVEIGIAGFSAVDRKRRARGDK